MSDDALIKYISLHCGLPEGPLREVHRDMKCLSWNVKSLGQQLAGRVVQETDWTPPSHPSKLPLICKPTTQQDMQSAWFSYWCARLRIRPVFHRKLWEYAYIAQALWERDKLQPGTKGLGFGCGTELFPSFFAAQGSEIVATDLHPEKVAGMGWAETNQHSAGLESLFRPELIDRAAFNERVALRFVDMNDVPGDLHGLFDYCWSICALEHLGSIEKGLHFIRESVRCLKPGGVAVHTTEFNFAYDEETLEMESCVLFRRKDFEQLAAELRADGHEVETLDFAVGDDPLDTFIDIPPYKDEENPLLGSRKYHPLHMKLTIGGYPSTCYGIIVKAGSRGV